jgi:hypothetical protein
MPMTPAAAKQYKPRRTPGSLDDVIYPETRAKMEEAKTDVEDEKTRAKIKSMGYAKGGKVSSASKRADGIATKGKTKGTMIAMCGGGMMRK